jgi:hypothetical protein
MCVCWQSLTVAVGVAVQAARNLNGTHVTLAQFNTLSLATPQATTNTQLATPQKLFAFTCHICIVAVTTAIDLPINWQPECSIRRLCLVCGTVLGQEGPALRIWHLQLVAVTAAADAAQCVERCLRHTLHAERAGLSLSCGAVDWQHVTRQRSA